MVFWQVCLFIAVLFGVGLCVGALAAHFYEEISLKQYKELRKELLDTGLSEKERKLVMYNHANKTKLTHRDFALIMKKSQYVKEQSAKEAIIQQITQNNELLIEQCKTPMK